MTTNINEWMRHTLRKDCENINKMPLQWLEIERSRWTPFVVGAINFLINGGTFLLCTDSKRTWLKHYILSKLNSTEANRPFVPIYALDTPLIAMLEAKQNEAIKDLLDMSYPNYALWYIGQSQNQLAQFSLEIPESFLWILDESLEHSFTFQSNDSNLDFKLLQAYRVFEQALFAGICGEFVFGDV